MNTEREAMRATADQVQAEGRRGWESLGEEQQIEAMKALLDAIKALAFQNDPDSRPLGFLLSALLGGEVIDQLIDRLPEEECRRRGGRP